LIPADSLEHSLVVGDRPSICLGGYTKHWRDGKPVVTLGPFEKVSVDGATEVIPNPLTVRWENAVVWLWIGHGLRSLYRRIELQHQCSPAWLVYFDRLANDESTHNYPGLGFLELLLRATTTIDLECSYSEVTAIPTEVSTPDLWIEFLALKYTRCASGCERGVDGETVRNEDGWTTAEARNPAGVRVQMASAGAPGGNRGGKY
jgi:hypothetical protein